MCFRSGLEIIRFQAVFMCPVRLSFMAFLPLLEAGTPAEGDWAGG
jgi:hypothetical protein